VKMSDEQVVEEVIEDKSLGNMFDGKPETTETEVNAETDEPTGELAEDSEGYAEGRNCGHCATGRGQT